jgi:hypothetical protein
MTDDRGAAERRPDWGEAPDDSTFVGRAAELAVLRGWVLDERCRLVAVVGTGGIGKTTLATRHAGAVRGVALAADGHLLASGSGDGTVRFCGTRAAANCWLRCTATPAGSGGSHCRRMVGCWPAPVGTGQCGCGSQTPVSC